MTLNPFVRDASSTRGYPHTGATNNPLVHLTLRTAALPSHAPLNLQHHLQPKAATNRPTGKKPRRDTRAQQDSRLYNLTLDVQELKQQLHDLALRRELLHMRASFYFSPQSNERVLRTVSHYFQGFARGYRGAREQPEHCTFVQSIAHAELSMGITGFGVDMLLEQWRRYTELFHIHTNVLQSTELLLGDDHRDHVLVKCVLEFHGVFTREAVDAVFPRAQREPRLLLQVLGRELVCPMVFHLYFDGDAQLVRHDAEADFFSAVRHALGGDSHAALRFMEDVRVGQESMVYQQEELRSSRPKRSRAPVALICDHGDVVGTSDGGHGRCLPALDERLRVEPAPFVVSDNEDNDSVARSPSCPSAWSDGSVGSYDELLFQDQDSSGHNIDEDKDGGVSDGGGGVSSSPSRHSLSFLLSTSEQ